MDQMMLAEGVQVLGANGDMIDAYFARPLGPGSFPGVVVIHHMPGWDEGSKEITRKFADHGYLAICPNLHHREGPGTSLEMAAKVRSAGGVSDDQCVGDVNGAVAYLRSLQSSSGKVGAIGYCSGGRQTYLAACNIPSLNAAVDCYGGNVVMGADKLTPRMPVAPIDMTMGLACPMLGLFGAEDTNPDPIQVATMEEELKKHEKIYKFCTYENTGHAFFAVDRPQYRAEAATAGWDEIFAWFGKYLTS